MRKYKHRTTGYIATETNSEKNYKVSEPKNFTIPKWIVEDSVDWEEIKEEFPKIISFRRTDASKYVINLTGRDNYNGWSLNGMLHAGECVDSGDFEIYQVAISETETFTLGEKIYAPGTSYKGLLKEFRVIGNNEFKIGIGIGDLANIYIDMCSIKKYKDPIFITEDGVEKYKGDSYYYIVDQDKGIIPHAWEAHPHVIDWDNPKKPPLGKVQFHNLYKALQYIDENKPTYSKNQIKEAIESSFVRETYILDTPYCQIDKFKEDIFKQKLGL